MRCGTSWRMEWTGSRLSRRVGMGCFLHPIIMSDAAGRWSLPRTSRSTRYMMYWRPTGTSRRGMAQGDGGAAVRVPGAGRGTARVDHAGGGQGTGYAGRAGGAGVSSGAAPVLRRGGAAGVVPENGDKCKRQSVTGRCGPQGSAASGGRSDRNGWAAACLGGPQRGTGRLSGNPDHRPQKMERWRGSTGAPQARRCCRHSADNPSVSLRLTAPLTQGSLAGCGVRQIHYI